MVSSSPPRRAVGVPPAAVTSRRNEGIVAVHAEEAAFLWTQRSHATEAPHYSLLDLARLDERVEAHVDGLRLGGEVAADCCRENLANGAGPGEVFALAVLAFSLDQRELMLEALQVGCRSARLRRGLESALGWLNYDAVSTWIRRLHEAKLPIHRAVGLAAAALHRRDPGQALRAAIDDQDADLRSRALRAVGELGRTDLLGAVLDHAQEEHEECRFWAAWSAVLLGHQGGVTMLASFVERPGPFTDRALALLLRAFPLEESRRWISLLAQDPTRLRSAIVATGVLGDPLSVPWLIRRMEVPEHARLAGEAVTLITGADLERLRLDADVSLPDDADVEAGGMRASEYDENLPLPSAARVSEWWEQNQGAFSSGVRYLAGKPIDKISLREVLARGRQRARAAAAIELAVREPQQGLFNVRDRALRQERRVAGAPV